MTQSKQIITNWHKTLDSHYQSTMTFHNDRVHDVMSTARILKHQTGEHNAPHTHTRIYHINAKQILETQICLGVKFKAKSHRILV